MKKMLALLMTLVLALSCTVALAETAEAPAFQGITIESEYDMNRDALKNVLTGFGVDETLISIADTAAAVIDEAGERLVIGSTGIQGELLLKGTSLVNAVALLDDSGIVLGTNLLPSYALKITIADILRMMADVIEKTEANQEGLDMNAVQEAINTHGQAFINACTGAVTSGAPEQGDYVMDGVSYNVMVPLNVDLVTIVNAANEMVNNLNNDENVKAALDKLQGMGFDVNLDASSEPIDTATLPTVQGEMYMTIDEAGNQSGAILTIINVTLAGETEPATIVTVTADGANLNVDADFVTAKTQVLFASERSETDPLAVSCRLDAYVDTFYCGLAAVTGSIDNGAQFDGYLYVQDPENALAEEHGTLTMSGELTLGVADGATVLTVADLTGENSGEALSGVGMDLFGAAMGVFSTATELMPDEVGAITGLIQSLMGNSDTAA